MLCGRPFPVHVFPQIIRNAVYEVEQHTQAPQALICLLYTSPSPRDRQKSRMPSSA